MTGGPSRTYRYRITFRAPLPFVYRWCTDYQSADPKLEGEEYERRILRRSRGTVVYEDLQPTPRGWVWARHVVTLRPPNHWHSDSVGNYRNYRLEYDLRRLPDGSTELRFRGTRTPTSLSSKNPTAREFQQSMDAGWVRFRRHLEREYRASRPSARRARGRRAGRR